MTGHGRGVDSAMNADRPAKTAIRSLWADVVAQEKTGLVAGQPLYLTLCGAAAKDLLLLAERGIITLTETRALSAPDEALVAAVESSADGVLELQRTMPGLKVFQQRIEEMLRGSSPFSWPEGEARRWCRAKVVNLDFNSSLRGGLSGDWPQFPTLDVIDKLADLHTEPSTQEWLLLLTLQAQIQWPVELIQSVRGFLNDNFSHHQSFAELCERFVGPVAFEDLVSGELPWANLSSEAQQRVLMIFLPKAVASRVRGRWRIEVEANIRYGGEPGTGSAPMCSWVIRFARDARAVNANDAYLGALNSAVSRPQYIQADGTFHLDRAV